MLEIIKSIYFIKNLFSYVCEYRKLKIINYNKILQNSLNLNIIDYRILSGKYIIYETKEKGKEYNNYNDKLIF